MTKKLKVLQLGKFYPLRGGIEKVEYDLMTGLSGKRVECDMMCAMAEKKEQVIPVNENAKLICCRTLAKAAATMISPEMIFLLREKCKDYDIIHIHHPDPMACLALYLSKFKGRVILHWHSDIQKQHLLLWLYRPLQNWLIKRAEKIIGTTPVYLTGSPFLRHTQAKTLCIPIGVDPIQPDPAKVSAIQKRYAGKKIVFSLGRLVHYKGFENLIEAATLLGDDYVVLIGGTGPLSGKLQAQIQRSGLQQKVHLLGYLTDEERQAHYGACSVFCLCSIQKTEAFGIVQIEAMSCGKPVIATNIPQSGVSWVNAHGVSGLNVLPGNAAELANAIETVTKDEKDYKLYAQKARDRYESLFTKEQMIEKCLNLYKLV